MFWKFISIWKRKMFEYVIPMSNYIHYGNRYTCLIIGSSLQSINITRNVKKKNI